MARQIDLSEVSFLLIDDSRYMRSIVRTMLSGFGVRKISEAADAIEGFEEFRRNSVDIIIVDYLMDTLDGNEFTKLVRTANDSPNPFVPIIMLTAYCEAKHVMEARDAGVTEFLSKPVCASKIMSRIVSALEKPRKFIKANGGYFGPDRRRKLEDFSHNERRVSEA